MTTDDTKKALSWKQKIAKLNYIVSPSSILFGASLLICFHYTIYIILWGVRQQVCWHQSDPQKGSTSTRQRSHFRFLTRQWPTFSSRIRSNPWTWRHSNLDGKFTFSHPTSLRLESWFDCLSPISLECEPWQSLLVMIEIECREMIKSIWSFW